MTDKQLRNFLPERTCRKCGKRFIAAPAHIYRDKRSWYCSWTCYNHRKDTEEKQDDKRTT